MFTGLAYLSFSVNSNDAIGWVIRRCYKNCVSTDSVHIDTSTSFNIQEMNIAIFGDEKYDTMLFTDLFKNKQDQKGDKRNILLTMP